MVVVNRLFLGLLLGFISQIRDLSIFKGNLSTLLSLGTGLNMNISGRANIYLLLYLRGLTKTEIDSCVDSILEFAEARIFPKKKSNIIVQE